jgi:DNA-binding Lrp family transcriptional regulator
LVSAVVLVNTDLASKDRVLENLKLIGGVEEAHPLYGIYDCLIRIKADSIDELKNITKSKIKAVDGVTSSLTMLIQDRAGSMRY